MKAMKQLNTIIAVATLALCAPAIAGNAAPQDPAKQLECLIGSWKVSGTAKMPGSDKIANVNGSYDCKKSGSAVVCALTLALPDGSKLEANETWAYNAGDGSVHKFTTDNMGGAYDIAGRIASDGLTGVSNSTYQGKPYTQNMSLTFPSEKQLKLVCTCSFGSRVDVTAVKA